ncbi:MAG TPA: DUF3352 domain-containing protein [Solirubrobacterales bacterium]|nr:DUF3352 domain-containing protein [Solirubrobacterales bacterium]
MKLRLVLPVFIAALVAAIAAGCGGGSDSGSGGIDPASVAPAGSPVFLDFTIRPEGETKKNIEALAKNIAGVDDLGGLIAEELEKSSAENGEGFDFEKEVEPWLGEEGGLFLGDYSTGDFQEIGAAFQTSNEDEAREFVDKQVEAKSEGSKSGSYNGVDYVVEEDETGTTLGVFNGLVAFAQSEAIFKSMVDASEGENLAGEEAFTSATGNVSDESAADVYLDIGGLIEEAGNEIDANTQTFFDSVGIEPKEATAVASLVPNSDNVELDISSNVSGDSPPSGDASQLLGSLPGTSVGALASAEFGKRFNEGITKIDEEGIPGQVPPHQLKKAMKEAGVDLEAIANSIGDVGVYVTGNSEKTLAGALVMEAESDTQATNTVSNVGLFLRKAGVPGVTKFTEGASGFSIRSPELGRQPVVVAAKNSRIVIGYGLAATLSAFQESNKTLADDPAFEEAESALGSTPIAAFVDGPSALNLATALMPPGEEDFEKAKPYLRKIGYLAIGTEASDGLATAKLIVGVK